MLNYEPILPKNRNLVLSSWELLIISDYFFFISFLCFLDGQLIHRWVPLSIENPFCHRFITNCYGTTELHHWDHIPVISVPVAILKKGEAIDERVEILRLQKRKDEKRQSWRIDIENYADSDVIRVNEFCVLCGIETESKNWSLEQRSIQDQQQHSIQQHYHRREMSSIKCKNNK